MKNKFKKYLIFEAQKQIEKYHSYHNALHLEYLRKKERLSSISSKKVFLPEEWFINNLYNPFHVLKNKKAISYSVLKKLKSENFSYTPRPPIKKEIPKKDGGKRTISIFQIPDSVVSKLVYESLLRKNKHRFSSLSYAYRNDKNVHYAIQDIGLEFRNNNRLFVAEFDFSKFFDSIPHSYLKLQFEENGFFISDFEKKIIDSFLSIQNGGVGIPQGTSISLFLANVVCWKLDRNLEKLGIRFARYADDTIIWSKNYGKICKAYDILHSFSLESNIKINSKKSEGISLLTPNNYPSELSTSKHQINFLGYQISSHHISIKEKSVKKLKKEIAFILYKNLIYPLSPKHIKISRKPSNGKDKDFLRAIMQVRRYLYGNLSEYHLDRYLNGNLRKLKFKGLMSFYPLVDDSEQLIELDKWLISTILKVLKKRYELLKPLPMQFPFNLNSSNIIKICRRKEIFGKKRILEIPSFLRINKVIQLSLKNEGIEETMNPKAKLYNY